MPDNDREIRAAFRHYMPKACKEAGCIISRVELQAGTLKTVIYHNNEVFEIPDEWLDNPSKDIWGEELKPWLESRHAG